MGTSVGEFCVSACACASFSSTPADIAAAQASPEKGTVVSSGLCSSVDTATDRVSAASTNSVGCVAGLHSLDLFFAGELPWKAASRQSGTPRDGEELLSSSGTPSNALGLQEPLGVSSSTSSSSSISSSAPQFRSAAISIFLGRNTSSSSIAGVSSRLPKATGL